MSEQAQNVRVVGRYALYNAIAAGGMATVHLGRLLGPVGFSRTVAIKRLHAQFATDPEFVSMFLDEARLAARIRHPNVVPTLDVVATGGELFLVMEYVPGESVARLSRAMRERQQQFPLRILSGIMTGALLGLHAAHEAKDERGHPLGIVHRDVSPQNVLCGTDGVPRVLDFGVAKAAGRMQTTKEGQIKGKLSYMPPEQLKGAAVGRQTDIYAAGVMLWELVTGQRLFAGDNEGAIVARVLEGRVDRPSQVLARGRRTMTDQSLRMIESLDNTILRALAMNPADRFTSAREMALELERLCPPATSSEIGDWVENIAREVLDSRAQLIAEIESSAHIPAQDTSHVMSVLQSKDAAPRSQRPVPPSAGHPTQVTQTAGGMHPGLHGQQQPPQAYPSSGRLSYVAPTEGPPVTQPSSISVSTAGRLEDERGRRTAIAVVVGLLVGVGVIGTGLVWRYAPGRLTPTTSPTSHVEPSATAPTDAPRAEDAGAVAVAPEPSAAVAPSATVTPAAPSVTPKTGGGFKAPTPPKPPAVVKPPEKPPEKPPAGPDCSTPFWYDAQGVKHYKQECIGK